MHFDWQKIVGEASRAAEKEDGIVISNQVLQTTLDGLKAISRVDLCVLDTEGIMLATTFPEAEGFRDSVLSFAESPADSQVVSGCQFFKVFDEHQLEYVLLANGNSDDVHMVGRMAAFQIQNLLVAYKERFDKDNFIKNLLLDNLLLVDIYNRAKSIIVVKELAPQDGSAEMDRIAEMILDSLGEEKKKNALIAYGTVVGEIKEVSRSYKEARMALNVGKIFFAERQVIAYSSLGIGRLIYQLPIPLCKMFIREIFDGKSPDDFDEETLVTINKFFENSLNVSETSRQLYIHRNTLVYRLDKLQKSTGLDLRVFEDAITFKIALMVVKYMKYMENQEY